MATDPESMKEYGLNKKPQKNPNLEKRWKSIGNSVANTAHLNMSKQKDTSIQSDELRSGFTHSDE